jgi:hypothetical protein
MRTQTHRDTRGWPSVPACGEDGRVAGPALQGACGSGCRRRDCAIPGRRRWHGGSYGCRAAPANRTAAGRASAQALAGPPGFFEHAAAAHLTAAVATSMWAGAEAHAFPGPLGFPAAMGGRHRMRAVCSRKSQPPARRTRWERQPRSAPTRLKEMQGRGQSHFTSTGNGLFEAGPGGGRGCREPVTVGSVEAA